MSVFKQPAIQQLPTSILQEKYNEERERILDKLLRYYPSTQSSINLVLSFLRLMHDELERRGTREKYRNIIFG
jgi:hypothetical protein